MLLCLTGQTRADAAEQVAFHRTCLRYQCMDMTAQTVDTAGTTGEVHRIDLFRPHTGLLDDRANRGCNLITQCQCTQIKAFTVQVQRRYWFPAAASGGQR
jgi:hypothetical protein